MTKMEIEIRGHRAYVQDSTRGVLRGVLEHDATAFSGHDPQGRTWRRARRRLWRRAGKGRLRFPAGLVQRVVQALEAQGHEVQVSDRTHWAHYDRADQSLLKRCPPYQREFLAAVGGSPRGQLVVQRWADVVELIALLVCYFPQANIFLAVKNERQAQRLERQLRQRVRRFICRDPDRLWRRSPRVYVGCPATLAVCNADEWPVIVFADLESALAKPSRDALRRMEGSLLYAFLPATSELDADDQRRLVESYGEVIYRLEDRHSFTQVTVLGVGPFSYPPSRKRTWLQRKRDCVWHNPQRNRQIARIALAFVERDVAALRQAGLWSQAVEEVFQQAADEISVVVLVEVPEHARALKALLPGWTLLDSTRGVEPKDELGPTDLTERAIVTMVRAHSMKVAADVVIRADATASIPEDDYAPSYMNHSRMLVVDCRDDFDKQAKREARHRLLGYMQRGWPVQMETERNGQERDQAATVGEGQ